MVRHSIIALLLSALSSSAASWHVDKDASGAGNGTSWTDAWTSFGAVVWGGGGVVAGDTLKVSGGATSKDYGNTTLTVGAAGTSGNPITIEFSPDEASHNGQVIISKGGDSSSGAIFNVDRDFITVIGHGRVFVKDFFNTGNKETAYVFYQTDKKNLNVSGIIASNVNNFALMNYSTNFLIAQNTVLGLRGDYGIRCIITPGAGYRLHSIVSNYFLIWYKGGGPDGIQNGSGVSIRNNTFKVESTTFTTSAQHPDCIQIAGSYTEINGNDFINVGDSHIDYDVWPSGSIQNLRIVNNVHRIVTDIDPQPDFIRFYSTGAAFSSFVNVEIVGNTFVDNNDWWAIRTSNYQGGNPTASGCKIRNNIFYNIGNGSNFEVVSFASSSGFVAGDWNFDYNLVNSGSGGHTTVLIDGTSVTQSNGDSSAPDFTTYSAFNSGNVFTLATDTGAGDNTLGSPFDVDKVGTTRSGDWSMGAYELGVACEDPPQITSAQSVSGTNGQPFTYLITVACPGVTFGASNLHSGLTCDLNTGVISGTPSVAAAGATNTVLLLVTNTFGETFTNITIGILAAVPVLSVTPSLVDWGEVLDDTTSDLTFAVTNTGSGTLSGTAENASSPWSIIGTATYSLGEDEGTIITVRFSPTDKGFYSGTINFTGGAGATRSLLGTAYPLVGGTNWFATNGLIASPLVSTNGYLTQLEQTSITDAGRSLFGFSLSGPGTLKVLGSVNATNTGQDSFFVHIDSEPVDPDQVWDVLPLATNFPSRYVHWRGSGTFDNPEFPTNVWALASGNHKMVILGREANAQLRELNLEFTPSFGIQSVISGPVIMKGAAIVK